MMLRALIFLFLASCTSYSRDNIGFWDQTITVTSWGVFIAPVTSDETVSVTTWGLFLGPIGIGYMEWVRNQPPRTQLPKPELNWGIIE